MPKGRRIVYIGGAMAVIRRTQVGARWWILIALVLPAIALPIWAAKRTTVAQLEQMLAAERGAHKPDAEIARKISGFELSERLTDETLGRLTAQFPSGSQPTFALALLADRSAFLDPPASEVPEKAAPDAATQQAMLQAAQKFVQATLPRLPDLLATRTTFSFDDSPLEVNGGYAQRVGLHLVHSATGEITVRGDKEVSESTPSQAYGGLTTWGEFGAALLIIMSDSGEGKTTWSHWEQTRAGPMAVFRYEVPKAASHFEIDTPSEQIQTNGGSGRWARAGGVLPTGGTARMLRSRPAYEGSLWIDPKTGTISRVTLVADLKGNSTFEQAKILVEYGPVAVSDKVLICPVRSLALSTAPPTVNATLEGTATEWLNENVFTGYHLFGSTSRILTAGSEPPTPPSGSGTTPESAAQVEKPVPSPANAVASQTEAAAEKPEAKPAAPAVVNATESSNTTVSSAVSPINNPAGNPASGPAGDEAASAPAAANANAAGESAGTGTAVAGSATAPVVAAPAATKATEPAGGMTLHVNVNSVLVPVVVRDKQGQFVNDLQKSDFEVFDDGKPHAVSGFSMERHAPAATKQTPGTAAAGVATETTSSADALANVLPDRVTVYVCDDLHLTASEISQVQTAVLKTLDKALTGTAMAAIVSTSGKINSGLTRDPAKLRAAVMALRPLELFRTNSADCPKLDYYQADLIVNKHDANALQDAINQVMLNCDPNLTVQGSGDLARREAESAATRTLHMSEQDVLTTYSAITEYVRRMAKLPGEHAMILVSPGFLPIEEQARNAESRLINLAAGSNVTISALDARGLYITSADAAENMNHRDPTQIQNYRESAMSLEENSMGELADATGGEFFHNNNDLAAGLTTLLEAEGSRYVLELPLEGVKPDGAYHSLRVKVDRAGAHVQARQGYFAPQHEK